MTTARIEAAQAAAATATNRYEFAEHMQLAQDLMREQLRDNPAVQRYSDDGPDGITLLLAPGWCEPDADEHGRIHERCAEDALERLSRVRYCRCNQGAAS